MLELVLTWVKVLLVFVPLAMIPLMIFLERKGAAVIQDRPGPNRSAITIPGIGRIRGFGFVHNFSDVVKLLFKEDFIPKRAHKWFYVLAPMIPVITAVLTPALIPWFAPVALEGGGVVNGSVLQNHASLLLLFALGAVSVYGVVLGSWGSNSKYSLLGGLRSSAMMISYEISMGLGILGLILVVASFAVTHGPLAIDPQPLNLEYIVAWQAEHAWGLLVQPIGFFLFLISMFAETGRTPFDVAEGESELVGGFHTEYSAIKFALFFMGEYAHIVIASALMATLFCGGWHLPFLGTEVIRDHIGLVFCGGLILGGIAFLVLAKLVGNQRIRYARFKASDAAIKDREYRFFRGVFRLLGVGLPVAGIIAAIALDPAAIGVDFTNLLTALVQLGIVLAKTLFFCWLFVWVRWTLPRLRYDQIMGLGWKVLLNIALINLVLTALVVQVIR